MSTWSPENSLITNLGNALLASARVGLGEVQLTKVVARSVFESSISDVRRYTSADITPETVEQTGHIMAIRLTQYPDPEEDIETSLVTVRFSNDDIEDPDYSYDLKQIIIFAKLINTDSEEESEEVPYMVCQCDSSTGGDEMPARSLNPTSFDYDIYVIHSGVDEITISVRTEGYVWQDDFDDYKEEVEGKFDEVETSLVGDNYEGKSFNPWTPSYNTAHDTWSKEVSVMPTQGEAGATVFNSIENSTDNSLAKGERSTTFGKNNETLGDNSFAVGEDNYAGADNVLVSGYRNAIKAENSFISGEVSEIRSDNSASFGYANLVDTVSQNSFVAGEYLVANHPNQAVFGKYNDYSNTALYAFLIGGGSADDDRSNIFAVDWTGQTKSNSVYTPSLYVDTIYNLDGTEKELGGISYIKEDTGTNSLIANDISHNKATGPYTFAFGYNTQAGGNSSFATGNNSRAQGDYSFVTGSSNKADGMSSFASGTSSEATAKNSVALGNKSRAYGENSFVMSDNSQTRSKNSTILNSKDVYIDDKSPMTTVLNSAGLGVSNPNNVWNGESTDNYAFIVNSSQSILKDCGVISMFGGVGAELENSGGDFIAHSGIGANTDIKDSDGIVAIGQPTQLIVEDSNNSFAIGDQIHLKYARNCFLLGTLLEAEGTDSNNEAEDQIILGTYNKNDPSKLLIVGNGNSQTGGHNALTIAPDGKVYLNESETSLNDILETIPESAEDIGAIPSTEKGAANGVAELDSSGKVPVSQIPGSVAGLVEGYYYNDKFYEEDTHTTEITPQDGVIYVDLPTNKTYRWSGSQYTEISESLALGETSSTAYRGDRGKAAYDHASDSNKSTTAAQSGLYKIATTSEGHIASYVAVTKSDITDLGIPAQDTTYVFEGTYNASTNKAATMADIKDGVLSTYTAASSKSNITTSSTVEEAVEQLDFRTQTNENNILIQNITAEIAAETGYTISNMSNVWKQGNHVWGQLIISIDSGEISTSQTQIAHITKAYAPSNSYIDSVRLGSSAYNVSNSGYLFITNNGVPEGGQIIVSSYNGSNKFVNAHIDYTI